MKVGSGDKKNFLHHDRGIRERKREREEVDNPQVDPNGN